MKAALPGFDYVLSKDLNYVLEEAGMVRQRDGFLAKLSRYVTGSSSAGSHC